MNADMLNRGTEYSPPHSLFLGGGAANAPSAPPLVYIQNIGVKQAKIYSKFPQKPPNKTKLELFLSGSLAKLYSTCMAIITGNINVFY